MEVVYGILKGINVALREINEGGEKQKQLTMKDFQEKKTIKLNQIEIINREYFEQLKAEKTTKDYEGRFESISLKGTGD